MADMVRDNFVRRWAIRLNVFAEKSRGKKWRSTNRMGWRIMDSMGKNCIEGEHYTMTVEQVEAYLSDLEERLKSQ